MASISDCNLLSRFPLFPFISLLCVCVFIYIYIYIYMGGMYIFIYGHQHTYIYMCMCVCTYNILIRLSTHAAEKTQVIHHMMNLRSDMVSGLKHHYPAESGLSCILQYHQILLFSKKVWSYCKIYLSYIYNELSTLVYGKAKCKQTKANT